MTLIQLFTILVRLALLETPTLHDGQAKHQQYLDGMREMSRIYLEVGASGDIVSPAADPLLLAAMGYEESRHRPNIEDGDCRFVEPRPKQACNAFGPMQLSKATPGVLGNIDPKWKGYTVEVLRNQQTNVEAAYRLLRHYKDTCSGGPASWLGAWSAGRCTKKPIRLGLRRCYLASAMAKAAEVPPIDCGAWSPDKRTLQRAAAILEAKAERNGAP